MLRNRRNQHMVYCKHSESIIDRGTCEPCNEAKRGTGRRQRPPARFTEGYHYGWGSTSAPSANYTVWQQSKTARFVGVKFDRTPFAG